jgi:hypothetical protein
VGLRSAEEYFARQARQQEEKQILNASMRDSATSADDKHHAEAVYHMTWWGRGVQVGLYAWLVRLVWLTCQACI